MLRPAAGRLLLGAMAFAVGTAAVGTVAFGTAAVGRVGGPMDGLGPRVEMTSHRSLQSGTGPKAKRPKTKLRPSKAGSLKKSKSTAADAAKRRAAELAKKLGPPPDVVSDPPQVPLYQP